MALTSVLIANRGEIACRVIRTARAQGLRTVAVYSEADQFAPHCLHADESVLLGPGPVSESYLRGDKVIEAALRTGVQAIHPGYGFLSENADFARRVEAAGLVFVGPSAEAIEAMGNKAEAKRLMMAAGIPCVPGYEGEDQSDPVLVAKAQEVGLPVMVKAAAGGGGRGMRLVQSDDQLTDAIRLARSEAENAFGSGELIIEKAIMSPRHVEIQIFADAHGNIIHLGERDCSVQRRHQKVIEESPCPVMTPELRARMGQAAVDAARAVDYRGAGTVEFLLGDDGAYYFLEMNTRLQVEHPVTELVTGLDLVALQFAVADGAPLPLSQDDVQLNGHAIEVRLYAEDPSNDYLPVVGQIDLWRPARGQGVRVDDGIMSGQEVSPFYDAMLAKIIAHADSRDVALRRLIGAVEESVLLGLKSNAAFLADILAHPLFVSGGATTAFLDQAYPDGFQMPQVNASELALAAACLAQHEQARSFAKTGYVSKDQLGWSSVPMPPVSWTLTCEGAEYDVRVRSSQYCWFVEVGDETLSVEFLEQDDNALRAKVNDAILDGVLLLVRDRVALGIGAKRFSVTRKRAGARNYDGATTGRITAPMPGLVLEVAVQDGQRVAKGDTLVVLEAMKMQHQLTAPFDGMVSAVHAAARRQVSAGDVLLEMDDKSSELDS